MLLEIVKSEENHELLKIGIGFTISFLLAVISIYLGRLVKDMDTIKKAVVRHETKTEDIEERVSRIERLQDSGSSFSNRNKH